MYRQETVLTNEELDIFSDKVLDRVSANVKKYRELKSYSQIQLALEIGMNSGAYLGRAEIRKDSHHFNIKHLAKISKVLDVPIASFFETQHPLNKPLQGLQSPQPPKSQFLEFLELLHPLK